MASFDRREPRARPERVANGSYHDNRPDDRRNGPLPAGRVNVTTTIPAAGRQYESPRSPPFSPFDFGPLIPPPTASESPYRKRRTWPPAPRCEDEKVSLAKEARHQRHEVSLTVDDIPFRGTIDQDPIILSTEPQTLGNIDFDGTQKTNQRTSSQQQSNAQHSKAGLNNTTDRKISSDSKTTRQANYDPQQSSRTSPKSPRRDSHRLSPVNRYGSDYFATKTEEPESVIDNVSSYSRSSTSSLRSLDWSAAAQPSTSGQYGTAANSRRPTLDIRRNTDIPSAPSTNHKLSVDKTRRPTPLMVSSALSELDPRSMLTASPDILRSGNGFATTGAGRHEPSSGRLSPSIPRLASDRSPQRSPRASLDVQHSFRSSSASNSRASSLAGSRPVSPSAHSTNNLSRTPKDDLDWNAMFAANRGQSTTQNPNSFRSGPTRASQTHDGISKSPAVSANARPVTSYSLPYPEDDLITIAMPLESDHQYLPGSQSTSVPPKLGRSESLQNSSSLPFTAPTRLPAGTNVANHRTVSNMKTTETRPSTTTSRPIPAISADMREELLALLVKSKKAFSKCRRSQPKRGYDDWYVVVGAPSVELCPDCVDAVFERSSFRPMIRRAPPKNLNVETQCAFGGAAWIQRAWLLTLQKQRTNMGFLKDIADIEASQEPCPGRHEAVRSWYGLRDLDGLYVQNFHVCEHDVRKIEQLFLSTRGMFVRFPSKESHVCAMRSEGNRFSIYLDSLVSIDDQATRTHMLADPMPLIGLVERTTRIRECTRDNMLIDGLWHFIPNVPEFTVCEDCFEAVVEPEIRKRSNVATRFNRTVQPVRGEGMGISCQLYSRRMRKIFKDAVENQDWRWLAGKAIERREAEVRLQGRFKDLTRRYDRLCRDDHVNEHDERRLQKEMEDIRHEWQSKWE